MKANSALRIPAAVATGLLLAAGWWGPSARALTPDSPQVKKAIRKGVAFLESEVAKDDRVGARALMGLVMVKNHADPKHPRITEAVTAIQAAVVGHDPKHIGLDIYSAGLAVIFLATLDAHAYGREIDYLMDFLKVQQKPHGGWGYPDHETGDTSMTQYGVLSAWEAKQAGCKVSRESVEKVADWLLRTQDPSGAFGYQGTVSPLKGLLIKQSETRSSMAAAGLGSVYMSADLLELVPRAGRHDENLPPALKEVAAPQPPPAAAADVKPKIDIRQVKEAERRGNGWMSAHTKWTVKEWWVFYSLYAYERYASYRELAEGRSDKEPAWYTTGAQFLIKNQNKTGSWGTKGSPIAADGKLVGNAPDTAFAILFLLRSSKKSIEKAYGYGDSTLVAGRGLPKETAKVSVSHGKVLSVPQWTTAAELLPILQNRDDAAFEKGAAALAQLPAKEAEILAAKQADLLRRLVADRAAQVRAAAVQAIGNGSNLDLVPTLIYALGDPDVDVACQACEALRRLSRSPGPGAVPAQLTDARRREEMQHWKQWYLALRPEAEFYD